MRRVERAGIDQMAGMRRHDMGAVASILEDAQAPRRQAHIVLLARARGADAAADPGIDDPQVADLHALRIRSELRHPPDDLVPHRQRQHHASILERHLLPAAEVVIPVPDVQVGVADAAMSDLDQDLRACGFRRRQLDLLQRFAAFHHRPCAHRSCPLGSDKRVVARGSGVANPGEQAQARA